MLIELWLLNLTIAGFWHAFIAVFDRHIAPINRWDAGKYVLNLSRPQGPFYTDHWAVRRMNGKGVTISYR